MGKVQKIVCTNCGREISGIKKAQADGWLLDEADEGLYFCCCVCKSENNKKKVRKK